MINSTSLLTYKTILVIDDDPMIQRSIFSMLDGMSANIIAAPDCILGLELAKRKCPDLILLDWHMPKLSGIDALCQLKSTPKTADIPVIMMSAIALESMNTYQSLTKGADDFLRKPFDKYELTGRLTAIFRLYEAKKTIENQRNTLQRLAKEKLQLMTMLAHDLKSPLNNLEGISSLLKMKLENKIPHEVNDYLELIPKIVSQEQQLIDEVLLLHEQTSRQMPIAFESIELNGWVEKEIQPYYQNSKNIKISIKPFAKKLYADISPLFLRRILDNLLSNAIKYSLVDSQVSIRLRKNRTSLFIEITDQGQGFHEHEVSQVFKKFRKFSARPTGGETSNGLGLYIVHDLVNQLNGQIELQSTHGKGSTFIITLPLKVNNSSDNKKGDANISHHPSV